jgi:hypothetical protein
MGKYGMQIYGRILVYCVTELTLNTKQTASPSKLENTLQLEERKWGY